MVGKEHEHDRFFAVPERLTERTHPRTRVRDAREIVVDNIVIAVGKARFRDIFCLAGQVVVKIRPVVLVCHVEREHPVPFRDLRLGARGDL